MTSSSIWNHAFIELGSLLSFKTEEGEKYEKSRKWNRGEEKKFFGKIPDISGDQTYVRTHNTKFSVPIATTTI